MLGIIELKLKKMKLTDTRPPLNVTICLIRLGPGAKIESATNTEEKGRKTGEVRSFAVCVRESRPWGALGRLDC